MPTPPRGWLFIYGTLILAVLVGGGWFLRHEELRIRHKVVDQLESIAQLKIHQIQQWRAERLGDAQVLVDTPFVGELVAKWLLSPSEAGTAELLGWFRSLQKNYHYSDVILLDAEGRIRLRLAEDTGPICREILEQVRETGSRHQAVLTDLHQVPLYQPHQDVISPLYKSRFNDSPHVATIILRIDANTFLYPMIQSWPVESGSGETLLVRRQGDEILFLNELRHQRDSALKLLLPLKGSDLPVAKIVGGQTGVATGLDYRGIEVIAVGYPVQGTNLFIVANPTTQFNKTPIDLTQAYLLSCS